MAQIRKAVEDLPASAWTYASQQICIPGTRYPAYLLCSLLLNIIWFSWTTVAISVGLFGGVTWLNSRDTTPIWWVRRLRSRLRGGVVHARPTWYRRRKTRPSADLYAQALRHARSLKNN